jgi:hypothetical protein
MFTIIISPKFCKSALTPSGVRQDEPEKIFATTLQRIYLLIFLSALVLRGNEKRFGIKAQI